MNDLFLVFASGTTGLVLAYGFLLGLKHATEADHLAAVSTMITSRANLWTSALVGGLWGLGHTISLLIAGIFVLLLNCQISERTERFLELGVGAMLVLLGLNVVRKLFAGGHLHLHSHEHRGHKHAHPHLHEPGEAHAGHAHHGPSLNPRPLLIGMVHGLAGSAALMLLIIPTIESRTVGMLYIMIFGIGSIGGMMLMSFLVGLPFRLTGLKFHRFNHLLQAAAGLVSICLGLWIVYEKGFSIS